MIEPLPVLKRIGGRAKGLRERIRLGRTAAAREASRPGQDVREALARIESRLAVLYEELTRLRSESLAERASDRGSFGEPRARPDGAAGDFPPTRPMRRIDGY